MRVELLHHPECPWVEATHRLLHNCLTELGATATVIRRVGSYPSPTVLVDGVDVMTGSARLEGVNTCRLDRPTRERILAALSLSTRLSQ
jgi:hypothetical protein